MNPSIRISLFQAVAEHEQQQQQRQQEADNKWEKHLLETTDQYIKATRTKRLNRYLVGLKALSTRRGAAQLNQYREEKQTANNKKGTQGCSKC